MHYGIIAAGEGSRLSQEGVLPPKPLVRLHGVPMIQRLMDIFMANGAESIAVIVNEQMTEVREYMESVGASCPVPLRLVVKSTPSSMHSFYELSRVLPADGRFILTTVDTVFRPEEFAGYVRTFARAEAYVDALMPVTGFIDDEKPLYVDVDEAGRITAFLDKAGADTRYVSGGIYGLTPRAFGVLRSCMEQGVHRMRNFQRALLASGMDVRAYLFDKIIDVDHAGDIPAAEVFLDAAINSQTCQK